MAILFEDRFERNTEGGTYGSLAFEDNFNRTVASGIGDARYTLVNAGSTSVNGSELVIPAGSWGQWDVWDDGKAMGAGFYEFDFYVGIVTDYHDYYLRGKGHEDGQIAINVYRTTGGQWSFSVGWISVTFTPQAATWYTSKVAFDPIGGSVRAKVWIRGTTEPDWMWVERSSLGNPAAPTMRLYVAGGDSAASMLDNLKVYDLGTPFGGIGDTVNYTRTKGYSVVKNGTLQVSSEQSYNDAEWVWNGAPVSAEGFYKYDFYVPSGAGYRGYYRISTGTGGLFLQTGHVSGNTWDYDTNTSSTQFTTIPDSWYTLKAHFDKTNSIIRTKVWLRSTPEPEGWTKQETLNANWVSAKQLFMGASDSSVNMLDNLVVSTVQDEGEEPPPPVIPDEPYPSKIQKSTSLSTLGRRNKQQILKDFIRASESDTISSPDTGIGGGGGGGGGGTGNCVDYSGGTSTNGDTFIGSPAPTTKYIIDNFNGSGGSGWGTATSGGPWFWDQTRSPGQATPTWSRGGGTATLAGAYYEGGTVSGQWTFVRTDFNPPAELSAADYFDFVVKMKFNVVIPQDGVEIGLWNSTRAQGHGFFITVVRGLGHQVLGSRFPSIGSNQLAYLNMGGFEGWGSWFYMRMRTDVKGNAVRFKVWPALEPEPVEFLTGHVPPPVIHTPRILIIGDAGGGSTEYDEAYLEWPTVTSGGPSTGPGGTYDPNCNNCAPPPGGTTEPDPRCKSFSDCPAGAWDKTDFVNCDRVWSLGGHHRTNSTYYYQSFHPVTPDINKYIDKSGVINGSLIGTPMKFPQMDGTGQLQSGFIWDASYTNEISRSARMTSDCAPATAERNSMISGVLTFSGDFKSSPNVDYLVYGVTESDAYQSRFQISPTNIGTYPYLKYFDSSKHVFGDLDGPHIFDEWVIVYSESGDLNNIKMKPLGVSGNQIPFTFILADKEGGRYLTRYIGKTWKEEQLATGITDLDIWMNGSRSVNWNFGPSWSFNHPLHYGAAFTGGWAPLDVSIEATHRFFQSPNDYQPVSSGSAVTMPMRRVTANQYEFFQSVATVYNVWVDGMAVPSTGRTFSDNKTVTFDQDIGHDAIVVASVLV
jgi:hypothetical protein